MADAPSQLDLFDHKPKMQEMFDKDLPESVRNGQRITTMTSGQARFPVAPSIFKFQQYGKSGAWLSELMPQLGSIADDLTFIKTVNTDAINHDPAITFIQTGSQIPGRPSAGAWLSYGIGSPNQDLPAFVVLHSRMMAGSMSQALFSRLWGARISSNQTPGRGLALAATRCFTVLSNPPGVNDKVRRQMLDGLAEMNHKRAAEVGDPETISRIAQYEMAYRMQTSVPELTDISQGIERKRSTCTAPKPTSLARSPTTVCSRGGWPSGACASPRCSSAAGIITPTCRSAFANWRRRPTLRLRPW